MLITQICTAGERKGGDKKEKMELECGTDDGGEVEMCVGDRGLEGIIDLFANVSSIESILPPQGGCLNSLHG